MIQRTFIDRKFLCFCSAFRDTKVLCLHDFYVITVPYSFFYDQSDLCYSRSYTR